MSFCLSFHLAVLRLTGAYWLDDPSDVSCKQDTGQHAVDGPLLSCNRKVIDFFGIDETNGRPSRRASGHR